MLLGTYSIFDISNYLREVKKEKKRKGRHNDNKCETETGERKQQREPLKNPIEIETWRIYGIDCHPPLTN